ncbi:uncharacterized protein LOC121235349 [Juglans microcarpa x Juglans regia]|uniref:uncharacterized protein LOC121235349 n=1 Tax=Juglans microcarpa x Juglans regia TaxID=2249226 RepID=UPI001B7E850B|nr:uncharacterized protein LOC121235349 [Juglans microcarpa x Juglans regia]
MEGCFAIDPVGKIGGLALFWKDREEVQIQTYSHWHVSARVRESNKGNWVFTDFYGHPDTSKRRFSWELLNRVKPTEGTAWCVAGDFNEILSFREKVGGKLIPEHQLIQFRGAMESNNLFDAGCVGNIFTWSNRRYVFRFEASWTDFCLMQSGKLCSKMSWWRGWLQEAQTTSPSYYPLWNQEGIGAIGDMFSGLRPAG